MINKVEHNVEEKKKNNTESGYLIGTSQRMMKIQ